MNLEKLLIYPLKSACGTAVSSVAVKTTGFFKDREFAVMNSEGDVLTAREKPELLKLKVHLEGEILKLSAEGKKEVSLNYTEVFHEHITTSLFKKPADALATSHWVNKWLTEFLNESCQLIAVDKKKPRFSLETQTAVPINFSDSCPVHLVTIASLEDLNKKLENKVTIDRFRPNIVISGSKPYEEELWENIQIGDCFFKVVIPTSRCVMITIDPLTAAKDKNQQPLRELSTYKKNENGVDFGIYLTPIHTGIIKLENKLVINP